MFAGVPRFKKNFLERHGRSALWLPELNLYKRQWLFFMTFSNVGGGQMRVRMALFIESRGMRRMEIGCVGGMYAAATRRVASGPERPAPQPVPGALSQHNALAEDELAG